MTIAPRPLAIVLVTIVTVFAGQVLLTSAADAPTFASSLVSPGDRRDVLGARWIVSNTGASVLNGDIGVSPGASIGGFPPGVYDGAAHAGDPAAARARSDLLLAYAVAAARTPTGTFTGDQNGKRLGPAPTTRVPPSPSPGP